MNERHEEKLCNKEESYENCFLLKIVIKLVYINLFFSVLQFNRRNEIDILKFSLILKIFFMKLNFGPAFF